MHRLMVSFAYRNHKLDAITFLSTAAEACTYLALFRLMDYNSLFVSIDRQLLIHYYTRLMASFPGQPG